MTEGNRRSIIGLEYAMALPLSECGTNKLFPQPVEMDYGLGSCYKLLFFDINKKFPESCELCDHNTECYQYRLKNNLGEKVDG